MSSVNKIISSTLILILFSLFHTSAFTQSEKREIPYPIFSSFTGTVYQMPKIEKETNIGTSVAIQDYYAENVYDYEPIGEITLEKLDVPETYVDEGSFPGVEQRTMFSMILHAEVEIRLDACYEFTLTSDDGSRIWIDEKQIVNNDGGHKMKTTVDSMAFAKGKYPVKLWYFQGMPDRFGLKLETKIVGRMETCPVWPRIPKNTIVLNDIHFIFDKYGMHDEANNELEKAIEFIKKEQPTVIEVVGHTDNQGTDAYNQILSLRRADTIVRELKERLPSSTILYTAIGKGENEPIADNDTSEGRALNRRVELKMR